MEVTRQYLENGSSKLVSFWKPDDSGYVMCKLATMLLEGKEIADGTDLGVSGFNSIAQSPEKPNLFYGSAWVDVSSDTVAKWSE